MHAQVVPFWQSKAPPRLADRSVCTHFGEEDYNAHNHGRKDAYRPVDELDEASETADCD